MSEEGEDRSRSDTAGGVEIAIAGDREGNWRLAGRAVRLQNRSLAKEMADSTNPGSQS
jgi:hypothetical protein